VHWPNVVGKSRVQPSHGAWHDWKQEIADHCNGRCIYCAISEARFGGIRNFHIEHYRPKKKFPKLENDIKNLYLACAICNVLKCDDWPAEPKADHSVASYPDPAIANYNDFFKVSKITHAVDSHTVAGKYLIERLLLNRGQLTLERRLADILERLEDFQKWVMASINDMTAAEWRETIGILSGILSAQKSALTEARPYLDTDTKRKITSKGQKRHSRS
jgi:hypothetical protein